MKLYFQFERPSGSTPKFGFFNKLQKTYRALIRSQTFRKTLDFMLKLERFIAFILRLYKMLNSQIVNPFDIPIS